MMTRAEGALSEIQPVRVLEVDVAVAIPAVSATLPSGRRHSRALLVVKLHEHPIGLVELDLGDSGLAPAGVAISIWKSLSDEVNRHLLADGLRPIDRLDPGGIPAETEPLCVRRRREAIERAPFVTVAIATRNRPELLSECLETLMVLEYGRYEILVVDNAPSDDATHELIRNRYASAPIRYVREPEPGLAIAHNRALRETSAEVIAFTDDDVLVDRLWLLELVRRFECERVACVTGMILPFELETPSQLWLEQYGGFSKGFHDRVFDLDRNRPADPLFPYAAGRLGSGASMAFRTDVLRRIGGFDPAIGVGTPALGGDDLAAFFDIVASGHAVAYTPCALVRHRHYADYESLRRQAYGYGVGLTAFLTKTLVDRPTRVFEVARMIPRGLVYALSPASGKNAGKSAGYPRELTWLELRGMLRGPDAYLRSRAGRRTRAVPTDGT